MPSPVCNDNRRGRDKPIRWSAGANASRLTHIGRPPRAKIPGRSRLRSSA